MQLISEASLTLPGTLSFRNHLIHSPELEESKRWLFLAPGKGCGLILQRRFYADFVGVGAILGSHMDYKALYPIGRIHVCVATTLEQRQQAIQNRIAYSQRLAGIAKFHDPRRRASLIVEQLCEWVGEENAQLIPPDLAARLVGVFPRAIRTAWQQRSEQCQIRFLASDQSISR